MCLIITLETPAVGGISLALRGSGASGAHLTVRKKKCGAPESAAVGGDKKLNEIGAPAAPQIVLET